MLHAPAVARTEVVPYPAFLTDDAETILNFAVDAVEDELGCALVTLVEIRGTSSRSLGSQMVVREDGAFCGYVSGGCTETAVASEAIAAIDLRSDRLVSFGEGSPFFDIQMPCGGGITVLIHVLKENDALKRVLARLGARQRSALCYDRETQNLSISRFKGRPRQGWHANIFVRLYRPTPQLLLAGRGLELKIAAQVAEASGFQVTVMDGSANQNERPEIDRDTAVVLLFHDIDHELPHLKAALDATPFYIGALGSRRTHAKRCESLFALGYSDQQLARIRAPVGVFGPARDAHSLAISVVADVAALNMQRS